MLSILVSTSYFLRLDAKQLERAKPYPPLASLQVAALLRESGHGVALFDSMLASGVEEYAVAFRTAQPQLVLFYEDNYNFLSKMCLARMRAACCEMIGIARRSGARVIVAGSDASDSPEPYLDSGAEVVLRGEGLGALVALVARLAVDPKIDVRRLVAGVQGVRTGVGDAVAYPSTRPALPVPAVPRPAWDLVDIDRYRSVWLAAHGFFSLNIAASRGCSFRCKWCAKPIWGNQYLQRPSADVAAEMLHLKRAFAPDHVWFADDIFGFRADWVSAFGAALQAAGGGVPYTIQLRADLVSARMARALRDSGCVEVWIGAESGSQRILDAMNKGTRVAAIVSARALLAEQGIRVGFFLQLGYLGEDLSDILATRALVERTRPDDVGVSVSYPLPGTEFYDIVKRQLGTKQHWEESNDLTMMFGGTYRTEFYRRVRDLLHDEVAGRNTDLLQTRWDDLVAREREFRRCVPADLELPQPAASLC